MTMQEKAAQPEVSAAHAGTVFDIGYQRYTGSREGRNRARLAVYKDGIRTALGFGRGSRAKVLPWVFIGVLVAIALVMALVAGAAQRFVGADAAEQLNLPSHSDYYGIASIIFFVFAAVGAPELLCPDRRDGVINLYLVRPLTSSDYVISRWGAFFTVTLMVALLPQFVLLIGLIMGGPDPVQYAIDNWRDVPRILGAGAAIAAYTTTLALLAAAFTTRRAYASVFLVGLFVITTPFTTGMAAEIGGTVGQWISMFNLSNIPVHVNDLIFGEVSDVTSVAPARELSASILVGWYFLWTVVPAGILWIRYWRLAP
jgi:ABC-2 type transport system permease protein